MAIHQFYLTAFPRKGIIEQFGDVPSKLEVDFNKRTENFLENEFNDEIDYLEELMQKCWLFFEPNPKEIITQIDKKLERENWGNDNTSNKWKTETNNSDNDAWLLTNNEITKIEEFTFRADLRQKNLKFLKEMIDLAKNYDLILMNSKGNLSEPKMNEIGKLIEDSNAFRYVTNPIKFLSDLNEGKIIIE